jgi:hypothetical protein
MKTKRYRNGKLTAKSYMKPAGVGFEVGFVFGTKTIFVGNFVRSAEANTWWALMNREIRNFSRRYRVTAKFPKATYASLLANHLHQKYYWYLDRAFARYSRSYRSAVARDLTRFKRVARRTTAGPKMAFLKAA